MKRPLGVLQALQIGNIFFDMLTYSRSLPVSASDFLFSKGHIDIRDMKRSLLH